MLSSNWEAVIATARLISLPEAFLQLKKVLDQPDFSMAEIAFPISQDPALTTRLLRLMNSSFYGFSGKIDTVFQAVTMIGSQQVFDLALATAFAQTFNTLDSKIMDMRKFWEHSVYCGLAAKNLAKACNVVDSERLFVAGLLHDIGHLIMYQSIPEKSHQAMLQAHKTGEPLHIVEREMIGLDYMQVGGALMRQWQLSESLRETTEFHLEPVHAHLFPLETCLVHIAVKLPEASNDTVQLPPHVLETTGLSVDQCIDIKQQTEMDVIKVVNSFFSL